MLGCRRSHLRRTEGNGEKERMWFVGGDCCDGADLVVWVVKF